jgi:hypothetical protein
MACWPAHAAAAWALVFGGIHLAWALGCRAGLTAEQARYADTSAMFVVYALAVVAVCGLAVVVALAMARPRAGRGRRTARLLGLAAWTGTAVLLLRAGGSIVPTVQLLFSGRSIAWIIPWEPWFWLGATLFAASTWRYHRQRSGHVDVLDHSHP